MEARMRTILLVILTTTLITACSSQIKWPVRFVGEYKMFDDVNDLPKIIVSTFNIDINCPGLAGKYVPINNVFEKKNKGPCRRMIKAGNFKNIWFIHYEKSGFGLIDNVIVYQVVNRDSLKSWSYVGRTPVKLSHIDLLISSQSPCLLSPASENKKYIYNMRCI